MTEKEFRIMLYTTLAQVQADLSNRGLDNWREDWRGWRFNNECTCTRCSPLQERTVLANVN